MRIYLSGAFGRKAELRIYAERLAWLGHPSTARWLKIDADTLEDAARIDAEDIKACDLVLWFSDPEYFDEKSDTIPRRLGSGARHTEVGLGLAWNKKIAVIAGHQNAFDFLPQVMHFATLDAFVDWLQVWHES